MKNDPIIDNCYNKNNLLSLQLMHNANVAKQQLALRTVGHSKTKAKKHGRTAALFAAHYFVHFHHHHHHRKAAWRLLGDRVDVGGVGAYPRVELVPPLPGGHGQLLLGQHVVHRILHARAVPVQYQYPAPRQRERDGDVSQSAVVVVAVLGWWQWWRRRRSWCS
jgi:hypothetical protein